MDAADANEARGQNDEREKRAENRIMRNRNKFAFLGMFYSTALIRQRVFKRCRVHVSRKLSICSFRFRRANLNLIAIGSENIRSRFVEGELHLQCHGPFYVSYTELGLFLRYFFLDPSSMGRSHGSFTAKS